MRSRFIAVMASALVVGCGSSRFDVHTEVAADTDLRSYATVGWMEEDQERSAGQREFAPQVKAAIESALESKGLRIVTSNPDLLVAWHATTEQRVRESNVGGATTSAYSGGLMGHQALTTYEQYDAGILIIQLHDLTENNVVYRGSGEGELDEEATPEERATTINELVPEILKDFPTRS